MQAMQEFLDVMEGYREHARHPSFLALVASVYLSWFVDRSINLRQSYINDAENRYGHGVFAYGPLSRQSRMEMDDVFRDWQSIGTHRIYVSKQILHARTITRLLALLKDVPVGDKYTTGYNPSRDQIGENVPELELLVDMLKSRSSQQEFDTKRLQERVNSLADVVNALFILPRRPQSQRSSADKLVACRSYEPRRCNDQHRNSERCQTRQHGHENHFNRDHGFLTGYLLRNSFRGAFVKVG